MSNSDTTEVKLQKDGQDINSSRSVRIRKCLVCRIPHSEHFFGPPNKNCIGMDADGNPNLPSKKSADSESEEDETDGKFIFKRFALRDDPKSEKPFVGPDEEARLMTDMEQLELEEQALIRRKRVEEVRRKVEGKKCNVEKLKQQEFGELTNTNFCPSKAHGERKMPLVNVGPSSKTLNTNKKLKDLVGKSYDGAKTPLDHLLGAVGTTGEAVDFLTNAVFGKENGSANPEQMFVVGGVNVLLNIN